MGKIGNALTMLRLLESGRKYKVQELAERLEVTPRMIKIYKEELEKSGIYIETIYGKYGGYVYRQKHNYNISFNYFDVDSIESILGKLNEDERKNINVTLEKIRSIVIYSVDEQRNIKIDKEEIRNKYIIISHALKNNNELIFGVMQREDNWFERVNFPIGIEGGGNTGHCPTENLVESYEMQASGLPVAPDAGYEHMDPSYDSQNPYEGRDPRMYELVAQNGAWWVYDEQVECWYGGRSGKPQKNATVTGYYLRKYVDGSTSLKSEFVTSKRHVWNIMRYSEILLNFAEAMVEAYGDPNYKDGYPMSAKEAVDIVRSRVHVDMPPFPNNLTLNEFKAKLRNERRVELSFEDHRFWDIRRWKIADQTTDIYGVDITKKEDGSFSYKKVLVEKRIFKDCMYLYPIPQSERYINPELEQNPGW